MIRIVTLSAALATLVTGAFAKDTPYPVNVATTTSSGDKIRGPATITLTGVNTIRRDVQTGVTVTFPSGPDLSLPFVPPIPKSGSQDNKGTTPPDSTPAPGTTTPGAAGPPPLLSPADQIEISFAGYIKNLNDREADRLQLQNEVEQLISDANQTKRQVDALVTSSDAALRTDPQGASLLSRIPAVRAAIKGVLDAIWPADKVVRLAADLAALRNNLGALQTRPGWAAWSSQTDHRAAYDRAVSRAGELITLTADLNPNSSQSATVLATVKEKLNQWDVILEAVYRAGPGAFSRTVKTTCSFGFGDNKESKVEMISADRLAAAGTTPSRQEIVTVVCSSPLTISGGFGFSTVHERDVDLIQSSKPSKDSSGNPTTTAVSVFGYKGRSSFRPLPLLLLNTRLHEWNDVFSLHASTGAVVDIKTGAAAGTDVEYIAGLSLGISRSFFVTGGFHAGRVPVLAGGFTIGQEVPTGISKAPVENHWSPGFMVSFTYKLK